MLGPEPSVLDAPSLALSGPNWEAVRKDWRPGERVQHWLLDDVHFTAADPFMKRREELKKHRPPPPPPSGSSSTSAGVPEARRPSSAHHGRTPSTAKRPTRPSTAQPRLHVRPAPEPPPPRRAAPSPRSCFVLSSPAQMPEHLSLTRGRPPQFAAASFLHTSQALPHARSVRLSAPPAIDAGSASEGLRLPPGSDKYSQTETARMEAASIWPPLGSLSERTARANAQQRSAHLAASAAAARRVSLTAWANALSACDAPPSRLPVGVVQRRSAARSELVDTEVSPLIHIEPHA